MHSENQRIPVNSVANAAPTLVLTEDEYNALNERMNAAMLAIYMARVSEISGTATRKSFANCLFAYVVGDLMFSFLDTRLFYRPVRQADGSYKANPDRIVTVSTSCTLVRCDRRVDGNNSWSTNPDFGPDGKVRAMFREMTPEAAERCANALVDSVKDFLNDGLLGLNLPFMTAVAGHVLIHDGITGMVLPDTWTGMCTGTEGKARFWYIGRSHGERSFSALQDKTAGAALNASNLIALNEMMES